MQPYIMHHTSQQINLIRSSTCTNLTFNISGPFLLVTYTHHFSGHLSNKNHYAYRKNNTDDHIIIAMTNLLSSTTQAISH